MPPPLGAPAQMQREEREAELLERLDFNMLIEMDANGDGIDTNEYVLGMLRILELVDEEKIDMLHAQFAEHDKDGSGRLDMKDLALIAKQKALEKRRRALILKGVRGVQLEQAVQEADRECSRQAGETLRRRSEATISRARAPPGRKSVRGSTAVVEEDEDEEVRAFVDDTIRSAVPTDVRDRDAD